MPGFDEGKPEARLSQTQTEDIYRIQDPHYLRLVALWKAVCVFVSRLSGRMRASGNCSRLLWPSSNLDSKGEKGRKVICYLIIIFKIVLLEYLTVYFWKRTLVRISCTFLKGLLQIRSWDFFPSQIQYLLGSPVNTRHPVYINPNL